MKMLSGVVGLIVMALLFPHGGVTGCPGGTQGRCISHSVSMLVRYPGDNGAVGMIIALVAAIVAALVTYYVVRRLAS